MKNQGTHFHEIESKCGIKGTIFLCFLFDIEREKRVNIISREKTERRITDLLLRAKYGY